MEHNNTEKFDERKQAFQIQWRNRHFKIMFGCCIAMILCELASYFLFPVNKFDITNKDYFLSYCLCPGCTYIFILLLTKVLLLSQKISENAKNYIVSIGFSCAIIALCFFHDIFVSVFAASIIALVLTPIYSNKKLTYTTALFLFTGTALVGFFCKWDADTVKDFTYFVSLAIILISLCGTTFISVIIIEWEEKRIQVLTEQQDEIIQLKQEVSIEPLTGLQNRRSLRQYIDSQTKRITFVMIDIDKFKPVNDVLGHDAGDKILSQLGTIINENIISGMTAFRYGGDEFLLASVGNSLSAVESVALRIYDDFNRILDADIKALGTMLSIGIAENQDQEPVSATIKRADKALYSVKGFSPIKIRISESL